MYFYLYKALRSLHKSRRSRFRSTPKLNLLTISMRVYWPGGRELYCSVSISLSQDLKKRLINIWKSSRRLQLFAVPRIKLHSLRNMFDRWRLNRSRKSSHDDKWNFCLTTAIIAVNRRDHKQTTAPEPRTGLPGEGGARRHQGGANDSRIGRAFRR
jgi:hypothetical protein